MTIPKESLTEKYGWKDVLSLLGLSPVGIFEPVICNDIKWIITMADKINGSIKWIMKNRLNVAPLTENPPHNHSTIGLPTYGIAETKFVITVAPQKDICPQGKT